MRPAGAAERESRARALLEEEGLREAVVRSRGLEGEIAAVAASGPAMETLRRIAPRLRALGYRYVALDVAAEHRTEE